MSLGRSMRAVAALQPGVVLADAVRDPAGHVLLPAGAALSESTIAGLLRRGVGEVAVVDTDPARVQAARDAQRARLEFLFRHAGDNAAARTLFHAVLAYRQHEPA